MLDSSKSPPILKLFLANLETIQTLLGELESRITTAKYRAVEVQALIDRADQLRKEIGAWHKSVEEWNSRHAPQLRGSTHLSSSTIKGTGLTLRDNLLQKTGLAPASISAETPLSSGASVTFKLLNPNGLGNSFFGVHSSPSTATARSFTESSYYGFLTTTTGRGSAQYQGGVCLASALQLNAGETATLSLIGQQLKLTGSPGWSSEMTLPPNASWYLHLITVTSDVQIV